MAKGLIRLDNAPETLSPVLDDTGIRRGRRLRAVGVALLAVFVAAGASGLLGVRSATTEASGSGYTVAFTHAAVARGGWDVPWSLRIRHPGGFDGPVSVSITAESMLIFETQRFWPEPSAETRDAERIYLTFDPPPGDELAIDYDAYVQPSAQRGVLTQITVITGGEPRVSLNARTLLLP